MTHEEFFTVVGVCTFPSLVVSVTELQLSVQTSMFCTDMDVIRPWCAHGLALAEGHPSIFF